VSETPGLRLFIAIELPATVLVALNQIQHALQRDPVLARLRWVRPEGIHLTLKFLGETPAGRREAIEQGIARAVAGIAPFELHLGKLGTFGGRQAPRVLWVDAGGDLEAVRRLQAAVERQISPLGFPAETRPFSPHLTLARVPPERARDAATPLADAIGRLAVAAAAIPVEEVALMKSDLRPSGAIYTQLFAARLT
jgi:2'-5' RNA ligase